MLHKKDLYLLLPPDYYQIKIIIPGIDTLNNNNLWYRHKLIQQKPKNIRYILIAQYYYNNTVFIY